MPPKLSGRVRVFDTGQGRKTDPVDAHSVAVAGLRSSGLRQVVADDITVALRLLVDRRDELGRAGTEVVSRIHVLLLELVAGGEDVPPAGEGDVLTAPGRQPERHVEIDDEGEWFREFSAVAFAEPAVEHLTAVDGEYVRRDRNVA